MEAPETKLTIEKVDAFWQDIKKATRPKSPTVQALLHGARPVGFSEGSLVLATASLFHKDTIQKPMNRRIIEDALHKILGIPVIISCYFPTITREATQKSKDKLIRDIRLLNQDAARLFSGANIGIVQAGVVQLLATSTRHEAALKESKHKNAIQRVFCEEFEELVFIRVSHISLTFESIKQALSEIATSYSSIFGWVNKLEVTSIDKEKVAFLLTDDSKEEMTPLIPSEIKRFEETLSEHIDYPLTITQIARHFKEQGVEITRQEDTVVPKSKGVRKPTPQDTDAFLEMLRKHIDQNGERGLGELLLGISSIIAPFHQQSIFTENSPLNNSVVAPTEIIIYEDLQFRSPPEIKIYDELKKRNVMFFPNAAAVLGGKFRQDGKPRRLEPDFLVCQEGKWGILEVMGRGYHPDPAKDYERERVFNNYSIFFVQFFSAKRCLEEPSKVVDDFLRLLRQYK